MTTIHVPDAPTLNEHLDGLAEDEQETLSTALTLYGHNKDGDLVDTLDAMDLLPPKPRNTLRELVQEVLIIDAVLAATGGELTPELEAKLDAVNAALAKKADGVRDYLAALEADAQVLKSEEQRLAARRKALEARTARFERYVLTLMQRMDTKELAGQFGSIKRKLNPPAVEVVNAALLPSQYRPETVVVNIDNTGIKKAIAATKSDTLYVVSTFEVPAFDTPHHYREVCDEHGLRLGCVIDSATGLRARSWREEDVLSVEVMPSADTQLRVTYRLIAARLTRRESLQW